MELFQHNMKFGRVYIPADIPFHHRQFSDDGTIVYSDPLTCADQRLKILYRRPLRNAKCEAQHRRSHQRKSARDHPENARYGMTRNSTMLISPCDIVTP